MFYRSPAQIQPPPQSKLKRYSAKCWYFCVTKKFSCSVWMLLTFVLLMIYFNDHYMNLTISLPTKFLSSFTSSTSGTSSQTSDISYLNPHALHSLYGTCPYTNPTYPSIGPDISYICPTENPYRIGSSWYLKDDILKNRDEKDTKDITAFFDKFNKLKGMIGNRTEISDKSIIKRLKRSDGLHLTYLYTSCQTEKEVKTIHSEWNNIIKMDEYKNILEEYGYKSWNDINVCFDKILCMNDNFNGGVTYNLYLDQKSQDLMYKLVSKSEEIQENKFNVDLTFKRIEQQSFHITFGTITSSKDYDLFDAKKLMDVMNNEIKGKFPCIRLTKEPPIQNYICKNAKKLAKTEVKFDWDCSDI